MSAISDLHQMGIATIPPTLNGIALGETFPLQIPQAGQEIQINLNFPDFQVSQICSLANFRYEVKDNLIIIKFLLDIDVIGIMELKGQLINNGNQFRIDEYFFSTELVRKSARATFVSSTFKALLGLSSKTHLQILEMGLDRTFKFPLELYEISKLLKLRQITYRLMIIEQATGYIFQTPEQFSATDQEAIAFICKAIIERSFIWPTELIYLPLVANQEHLSMFNNFFSQSPLTLSDGNSLRILFGKTIHLGQETVTILEGTIENLDKVEQQLTLSNGQKVLVEIRSLIGQIKVELPNAPRLPVNAWDPNIQSLIDLESKLDTQLADHYNDLAAATLAGLTDEEIAEVTARPELNFGIPDNEDGE